MNLLSDIIRDSPYKPPSEELRFERQKKRNYGPTLLMSKILPVLFTIGWIAWIALKIMN